MNQLIEFISYNRTFIQIFVEIFLTKFVYCYKNGLTSEAFMC